MPVRIRLRADNLKKIREAFAKRARDVDRELSPTARGITQVLLEMVGKRFARASRTDHTKRPNGWPKLSPLTVFIRSHRRSAPNTTPRTLNDRGLLRNATIPFVRKGGRDFGIVNPLRYAATHQFGGRTAGGSVEIGEFQRKNRKKGGKHKVKPYTMKLKSHAVPPRPFFPTQREYMPRVLKAIRAYLRKTVRPTDA